MSSRAVRAVLLLALAGCAGCSLADIGLRESVAAAPAPTGPAPAGRRALRVSLGAGAPGYATLLQEQGERRLWRTEDGLALMTDGPRVTATSGLPRTIMATRIEGADPLRTPALLAGAEAPARRLVDLATADRDPAGMRFGVGIACRLHGTAPEDRPELLRVEETCRGPAPVGSFTNRFTLRRADGAVLRSEQWIGPDLPALTIEPVS